MRERYAEGVVKSLTFKWEKKEKKWLSNEKELMEQFGHEEMDLEKVLSKVHFVSAAACGGRNTGKVVLFYIEPIREGFAPKEWIERSFKKEEKKDAHRGS